MCFYFIKFFFKTFFGRPIFKKIHKNKVEAFRLGLLVCLNLIKQELVNSFVLIYQDIKMIFFSYDYRDIRLLCLSLIPLT